MVLSERGWCCRFWCKGISVPNIYTSSSSILLLLQLLIDQILHSKSSHTWIWLDKNIVSLCNVNVVSICNIIIDVTFIRCPWLSVPSLPSQKIPRSHIFNIILTFITTIIIIIIWSSIKSYPLVQISNCFCLVSERAVPIVRLLHQFHPGFGLSTICLKKNAHYLLTMIITGWLLMVTLVLNDC